MWKVLFRARRRFARDQRGNVAILFAAAAVPLVGIMGGAVDITRQQHYRVEIANALDAAAIALVRHGATSDSDAEAFLARYVGTMVPNGGEDGMLTIEGYKADKLASGYHVTVNATMKTAFLPLLGMQEMPIHIESEVQMTGGNYEVALALDNTGSMAEHDKIGALKDASNHLIDTLYKDSGSADRVKMALVPFTTTVNIRGAAFKPEWLDPQGLGLGKHAEDSYDRPVSRLDIFDALSNGRTGTDGLPVDWKGCVVARADGHDIDDAAPGNDPATRWTPYLSPDGADSDTSRRTPSWAMQNSYLSDQTGGKGTALDRLRNTDKYFHPIVSARFDPFDTDNGPNQSCRGPIVELTNDQQRMHDAIDAMQPGGFTHIPQGLAWGWRVLSPGEPFTQGAPYSDKSTQKVLVLLSDGKNTFPDTYTSYGYRADGRLATDERTGVKKLNEKVSAICEAVKAKGIRLYMILLEENDSATRQIFEDCASVSSDGKPLYYEVPDAADLDAAFASIGADLTTLRVTR
jgi:Flp pilus assembly protein TadG